MEVHHTPCFLTVLCIQLVCMTLASSIHPGEAEIAYCNTDQNGTIWKCNYIPEDIPDGFSRVDIEIKDLDIYCYKTSFQSKNWQHVDTIKLFTAATNWTIDKNVSLGDNCFKNLRNLKHLLINIECSFYLSPRAFIEANSVTMLSLADCLRLEWHVLQEALDGSDKLPNLTDLDLSKVHIMRGPVNINEKFSDVLGTLNLTRLNLSSMQVTLLNGTALLVHSLKYLTHLNLSSMNLNEFTMSCNPEELAHIEELDLTNMTLPKSAQIVGPNKVYNLQIRFDQIHGGINELLYIRKIIANGLYTKAIFELYNCEFILNIFLPTQIETVVYQNNGLKHIDIKVSGDHKYRNTTLKHIDFSRNDMEFLHPTILSMAPNLISLRLSENNLYKMLQKDIALFKNLFYYNDKLRIIDMSTNGLDRIATHQFIHNVHLEEIDLSDNLLQQVDWDMEKLTKLKTLDLRNNRIAILDSTSLNNMDNLISSLQTEDQLVLHIENNPISCSQCKSKPFITWLTQIRNVHITSSNTLTCTQANGEQGDIDKAQLQRLQLICLRKTIIISCTTTLGTVVIAVVVLTYVLIRRRKIRRRHMKHTELLVNIQQGEGEFEFVAMLSYNSQEAEFIRQYVHDPLNNTLQTITGVDRNLVLMGDEHFRPGYMVHNEIASSLDRVSLVLLLITNDFCTSGYCLSELDQAWIHRKPMIFMFKDDVDENLMTPIMKTIYKKNVRILWTLEDGEYVLKTTWENVCHSILELIIN